MSSKRIYELLETEYTSVDLANVMRWMTEQGSSWRWPIEQCEEMLAERCNASYAVMVDHGWSALALAMAAIRQLFGKRHVVMPALSFMATWDAVVLAELYGGPLHVEIRDVSLRTWCLEGYEATADLWVPVSMYGAMPALPAGHVLLDLAEGLGGGNEGRIDAAALSFNGSKLFTSGSEGGAVVTDTWEIAKLVKRFRDHGRDVQGTWTGECLGGNHRINALGAAALLAQLVAPAYERRLAQRQAIRGWYEKYMPKGCTLQATAREGAAWWLTAVLLPEPYVSVRRELASNIVTRRVFAPFAMQSGAMRRRLEVTQPELAPNAKQLYEYGMTLPTFNAMQEVDVWLICRELESAVGLASTG